MSKANRPRKSKGGGGKSGRPAGRTRGIAHLIDDMRQNAYPPSFRIEVPAGLARPAKPVAKPTEKAPPVVKPPQVEPTVQAFSAALAEVATCLWYLKTKHFKREWQNEDTADDDPRNRRTLGRLNKGVDALRKCGVEVEDPTGKRYPTGGEAMMRPLDFVATQGLTYEKVSEAVAPMVYWNGRLIQRAEVFVAVPPVEAAKPAQPEAPVGGTVGASEAMPQAAEGKFPEPPPSATDSAPPSTTTTTDSSTSVEAKERT